MAWGVTLKGYVYILIQQACYSLMSRWVKNLQFHHPHVEE